MLLILPVLLYLGTWQLDRAAQKQAMFDRFDDPAAMAELSLVLDEAPEANRYRQVRASGRYWPNRQFLQEGMTHDGRPGLHVLSPFQLDNRRWVIVNRGWIPETRTRDTAPPLPLDDSRRTLAGRVVPYPQPGLRLAPTAGEGWPRRVLYPTPAELGEALGVALAPHMVWLDAGADDGFMREWTPAEFGPARHIGYAVQWFGLAVTLVLIYIIMKFRKRQ